MPNWCPDGTGEEGDEHGQAYRGWMRANRAVHRSRQEEKDREARALREEMDRNIRQLRRNRTPGS